MHGAVAVSALFLYALHSVSAVGAERIVCIRNPGSCIRRFLYGYNVFRFVYDIFRFHARVYGGRHTDENIRKEKRGREERRGYLSRKRFWIPVLTKRGFYEIIIINITLINGIALIKDTL